MIACKHFVASLSHTTDLVLQYVPQQSRQCAPSPTRRTTKRNLCLRPTEPATQYVFHRRCKHDSNDDGRSIYTLKDAASHPNHLALLHTCRQIYTDAVLLPWTLNTPYFASLRTLVEVALSLHTTQRAAITKIGFKVGKDQDMSESNGLAIQVRWHKSLRQVLPGVRSVEVDVCQYLCTHSWYHTPCTTAWNRASEACDDLDWVNTGEASLRHWLTKGVDDVQVVFVDKEM